MSDPELSWGDFGTPLPPPRKIKTCKKCGTDRFVGDKCTTCRKKRQAEWHQKNKDRIAAKMQTEEFKQQRRDRWNKNRAENLEAFRAKERRWRATNIEKNRARQREHRLLHPLSWERESAKRCNDRAREKGLPRGMKAADLYDPNTGKLPEFCPIFPHIKLDYNAGPDIRSRASVDRKVPELGYTSGNVWVISMSANTWKSSGTNAAERSKIAKLIAPKKSKNKLSDGQIPLF